MIGSVSSGFRRRRPRNATRGTIAAIASPVGSDQLRPAERADGRAIPGSRSAGACRADRAARPAGRPSPAGAASRGRLDCTFCGACAGLPLAIVGSTGTAGAAGEAVPSAVRRAKSLRAARAVAGSVASTATSAVSEAGLATASTAGGASDAGIVSAGSATTGTAGSAAGGGGEGTRGGSNVSGSTYPCGSLVTRVPKYTKGSVDSTTPLGPTVPTTDPSPTTAPRATPIDPRWTSVAVYPKGVWIDTVLPPVGTVPAKETTPSAGACTGLPLGAPRSTPRCWPPA
jgi:hypothetical protein